MCQSVCKADLLSHHFEGKLATESVDLNLTYLPSPSLIIFSFRLREVRRLMLDFDSHGVTNPYDIFHL